MAKGCRCRLLTGMFLSIIVIFITVKETSSSKNSPPPSAQKSNLYKILDLTESASQADIKKAYRRMALKHHPDKVPQSDRAKAEDRFKKITNAHEILSDESKRKLYDQYGEAGINPAAAASGGRGGPAGYSNSFPFGSNGGGSFPFGMNNGGRSNGQQQRCVYRMNLFS